MGPTYIVSAHEVLFEVAVALDLLDILVRYLLDILSGGAFFSSGPNKASTVGMNAGTGRIILFVSWVLRVAHALDLCYLLLSFCNWFPLLFGLFPSACTGYLLLAFL